jgi:hypothetical protein
MQYVPKKKDNVLPSTSVAVVEVDKNQQETHEGNKQNEEHEAERQQAHEIPSNDNDAIQHSTSFSMSLNNV